MNKYFQMEIIADDKHQELKQVIAMLFPMSYFIHFTVTGQEEQECP